MMPKVGKNARKERDSRGTSHGNKGLLGIGVWSWSLHSGSFFPRSTAWYEIRQCERGCSPCLHRSSVLGSSLYQLWWFWKHLRQDKANLYGSPVHKYELQRLSRQLIWEACRDPGSKASIASPATFFSGSSEAPRSDWPHSFSFQRGWGLRNMVGYCTCSQWQRGPPPFKKNI